MSRWNHWVLAARPQTLAASVVPVAAAGSLAWMHNTFHTAATLTALFCALAIQVGTNFANDYYDYKKGADRADRLGFTRAVSSGLIAPNKMLLATKITMGIAFLAGLYLVRIGGWPILTAGLLSLLFGILYTGGPWPLGYNGLGDLFVFVFFGQVAVVGTWYVNALSWSPEALWISLPIGALCVNILVVNNLRDINQDRISGKRTLGVLFGEGALKLEYLIMLLIAFGTLPLLQFGSGYNLWIYLPVLSLPAAISRLREIFNHQEKRSLNSTLEKTAKLMVFFGLLLSAGILLQNT